MLNSQTLSVYTTLFTLTGGNTKLITARMGRRTIRVYGTFHFRAFKFRVALIALTTCTHWFVVLDAALGIQTAVAWIATYAIEARFVRRTIGVSHTTSHLYDGFGGFACATSTADITIRTNANHSSNGRGGCHFTLGWSITRFQDQAGINTFVADASQAWRTVGIYSARWLRFRSAVNIRITQETSRTAANGQMILSSAFGSGRASALVDTRIHTLFIQTELVGRTIIIGLTTDNATSLISITTEATLTSAHGLIRFDITFSINSARIINQTWTDTISINTCLIAITFAIHSASDCSARSVGITLKTVLARTDGTMVSYLTHSVSSTVAWVAALSVNAGLLV